MLSVLFLVLTHQNKATTKIMVTVEWGLAISVQSVAYYELATEIWRVFFVNPLIVHDLNHEGQTRMLRIKRAPIIILVGVFLDKKEPGLDYLFWRFFALRKEIGGREWESNPLRLSYSPHWFWRPASTPAQIPFQVHIFELTLLFTFRGSLHHLIFSSWDRNIKTVVI